MLKVIAQIVSTILHPLVVPIYLLIYVLYSNTPWSFLPATYKSAMMTYLGVGTSVVPLLIVGTFILFRVVKDIEMPTRSERIFPLLASCIAVWFTYYGTYTHIMPPVPLLRLVEGVAILLTVATIITPFWKISLHSLGMGGLMAYISIIGYATNTDFSIPAIIGFAMSGIVTWARLYLAAHTPLQLLIGFIVGLSLMFLAIIN